MPKISTFMYCEETLKNGDDNQILLRNPLTVFRPAFVPGMFSFSIVFGISGIKISEKEYKLQLRFINSAEPNNPIINTGIIPLTYDPNVQPPDSELPSEHQGIMINMDFRNAILKNEGDYYTEVILNDEVLGTFTVYVKGAEVV